MRLDAYYNWCFQHKIGGDMHTYVPNLLYKTKERRFTFFDETEILEKKHLKNLGFFVSNLVELHLRRASKK